MFGPVLAFLWYLGAAKADGTPEQREALRTTVTPLIAEFRRTGDTAPIRAAVRSVMGADWAPSGEWAQAIDNLT
jgi:hypothetical protein